MLDDAGQHKETIRWDFLIIHNWIPCLHPVFDAYSLFGFKLILRHLLELYDFSNVLFYYLLMKADVNGTVEWHDSDKIVIEYLWMLWIVIIAFASFSYNVSRSW
jgi:hypothetical protein